MVVWRSRLGEKWGIEVGRWGEGRIVEDVVERVLGEGFMGGCEERLIAGWGW